MIGIYGHPFAAFYWQAAIALYECAVPFEFLTLDPEHPENLGGICPTPQPHWPVSCARRWRAHRDRIGGCHRVSRPALRNPPCP